MTGEASSASEPSWSARRLGPYLGLLFLAWQIALPLAQFSQPRPARFGWQMYSYSEPSQYFAEAADGSLRPIGETMVLANSRPEIRDHAAVGSALCQADPRAAAILVDHGDGKTTRIPCR